VVLVVSRWRPGSDDEQVQVVDFRCRRSCYGGGIRSGLELWQTRVPQWWQVGSPCQDVAM